jgi:hypothetical protein
MKLVCLKASPDMVDTRKSGPRYKLECAEIAKQRGEQSNHGTRGSATIRI